MSDRRLKWLTPAVGIAVVTSSMAGAVFTWWINREEPLRIAYGITTTTTGSDPTTSSLVPGLVLKIGEQNIPAIHTHVITLSRDRGYADEGHVAIAFATPLNVYGRSFQPPSPLHHINCDSNNGTFVCTFGPLDGQGSYQIALATDKSDAPKISTVGKDVTIASVGSIASEMSGVSPSGELLQLLTIVGGLTVLIALMAFVGDIYSRVFPKKPMSAEEIKDFNGGAP